MHKTTLYQLCGIPFSGKSTLTRALVKRYGFHVSSVDAMIAKHDFHVASMNQEDWNLVYAEAYEDLKVALLSGKDSILDKGSLKRSERDTARRIAEECDANYVLIYINTRIEVIQKRRKENEISRIRGGLEDKYFQIALDQFVPPQEDESHTIFNDGLEIENWMKENFNVN